MLASWKLLKTTTNPSRPALPLSTSVSSSRSPLLLLNQTFPCPKYSVCLSHVHLYKSNDTSQNKDRLSEVRDLRYKFTAFHGLQLSPSGLMAATARQMRSTAKINASLMSSPIIWLSAGDAFRNRRNFRYRKKISHWYAFFVLKLRWLII